MSMLGQEQSRDRFAQSLTATEAEAEKGQQNALNNAIHRPHLPAERMQKQSLARPPAQVIIFLRRYFFLQEMLNLKVHDHA